MNFIKSPNEKCKTGPAGPAPMPMIVSSGSGQCTIYSFLYCLYHL